MKLNAKTLIAVALLALLVLVQRLDPQTDSHSPTRTQSPSKANVQEPLSGKVHRVVDGDSLYLRGHKKQIRLWAVDAPETSEAGYQRAKDQLKSLAMGQHLSCYVQDVDKYGRTVARCEDKSGRDINKAMLDSGKANEYCRFSKNFYGHCG